MPTREIIDDRYWCPGPWPWQWFDTCIRHTTRWCYNFAWVTETRLGFLAHLQGCEAGVLYDWWSFAIGFGSSTAMGRACYSSERTRVGTCDPFNYNAVIVSAVIRHFAGADTKRELGPADCRSCLAIRDFFRRRFGRQDRTKR